MHMANDVGLHVHTRALLRLERKMNSLCHLREGGREGRGGEGRGGEGRGGRGLGREGRNDCYVHIILMSPYIQTNNLNSRHIVLKLHITCDVTPIGLYT